MPIIGGANFSFNRSEIIGGNRNAVLSPNIGAQVVEVDQLFGDGDVPYAKLGQVLDMGDAGISTIIDNQVDASVRFWAGDTFKNRHEAPFRILSDGSGFMSGVTIAGYKLFEAVVATDGEGNYETIAAALADGNTSLFLRDGVYELTADLVISGDNITIVGESRDGVIIQSGATEGADDHNIQVTGDNVILSNFTKTEVSSNAVWPIDVTGDNVILENLVVDNEDQGFRGIRLNTGLNGWIRNCIIRASRFPISASQGAATALGSATRITDNIITTVNNSNDEGVLLGGSNGIFSRNQMSNVQTGENGIEVEGDGWSISENLIVNESDVGGQAIFLSSSANNTKVFNNTIDGYFNGIVDEGTFNRIQGNTIDNVGNNGIESEGERGIISGNSIRFAEGNGMTLYNTRFMTICNNFIEEAGAVGILFDTTISNQGNTVCNNVVYRATDLGIFSSDAAMGVSHRDNVISNNIVILTTAGPNITISNTDSNIIGNVSSSGFSADSIASSGGNVQFNLEN